MVDSNIILINVEKGERWHVKSTYLELKLRVLCCRRREFGTSEKRSESRVLSAQLLLVILRLCWSRIEDMLYGKYT
jgi:hypothetical protein